MTSLSKNSGLVFRDWMMGGRLSEGLPRILVLDGGVSTHLEELGAIFRHRELWSSSLLLDDHGCNLIRQGHLDWLQAGANVISTVTYQCHYEPVLWPTCMMNDEVMNRMWSDGLDLAHQSVHKHRLDSSSETPARPHFVLASSGCYGAALANGAEYTGDYGEATMKDLERFHQRKLRQILSSISNIPDGVALETVPSLQECRALRNVLLSSSLENVACFLSLSCRDAAHLNDGTPLIEALKVLRDVPTDRLQALGLNCCDSAHLPSLLDILVKDLATQNTTTTRGVVIYPNSGEVWNPSIESWQEGTGCTESQELARRLMECVRSVESTWRKLRPGSPYPSILVGGCCRTRPATIAALRQDVDKHLANTQDADEYTTN